MHCLPIIPFKDGKLARCLRIVPFELFLLSVLLTLDSHLRMHISQAFHCVIWKFLIADGTDRIINELSNIKSAEFRLHPDVFVDHLARWIPADSSEIETRVDHIVREIFGVIDSQSQQFLVVSADISEVKAYGSILVGILLFIVTVHVYKLFLVHICL